MVILKRLCAHEGHLGVCRMKVLAKKLCVVDQEVELVVISARRPPLYHQQHQGTHGNLGSGKKKVFWWW